MKVLFSILCVSLLFFGSAELVQAQNKGCITGNCLDGIGTFNYPNGDTYTGMWSNGRPDGKGTFKWAAGAQYAGEFKLGKQHGLGTYRWLSGSEYTGKWHMNAMHGLGQLKLPTGQTKQGRWAASKLVDFMDEKKYAIATGNAPAEVIAETKPSVEQPKDETPIAAIEPAEEKPTVEDVVETPIEEIKEEVVEATPEETEVEQPTTRSIKAEPGEAKGDNMAPAVQLTAPALSRGGSMMLPGYEFTVQGTAFDESGVQSIQIGGVEAQLSSPNSTRTSFRAKVKLTADASKMDIVSTDVQGNTSTRSQKIIFPSIKSSPTDLVGAGEIAPIDANLRTALIIGNSQYEKAPLVNASNDADSIAIELRKHGFEVFLHKNLNLEEMEAALDKYVLTLQEKGGVGMFYFAGHGVQLKGENYLIPSKTNIRKERDVKYKAMHLGILMDELENAGNDLNVVVLDACRDNPYARSSRDLRNGLAATVGAPSGSLIAYSTSPGMTASDGTGNNGLYTEVLLQGLRTPGLKIEEMFKRIRTNVRQLSGGEQVPWENSSIEGDFFFNPR